MTGALDAIEARGRAIAEDAERRAIARVAATADAALSGVTLDTRPGGVVLAGRGLRARLLSEPVLRWIGSLAR